MRQVAALHYESMARRQLKESYSLSVVIRRVLLALSVSSGRDGGMRAILKRRYS